MKRYFTLGTLLFGLLAFGQQAGEAGELLRNEAGAAEMRTQQKTEQKGSPNAAGERRVFVDPNGMRGQKNSEAARFPQYNWNQNYGNSELFLRIPEGGNFTVEIADQQISNSTGKFRFFDLSAGALPINIYEGRYLLYRTRLNVQNGTRMILDFFSREGLYLLDRVPLRNQAYGFNQWDDVWNNNYGGGSWNNGYGNSGYNANVMNSAVFGRFLQSVSGNGFDDNKISLINQQARTTFFTAEQIKSLMRTMSFEGNRVKLAKMLYAKCAARQNFFTVYDALTLSSSRKELQEYISRI